MSAAPKKTKMDERSRRIVEVAMVLAERDGYEAVRLRELAARAEVALGTLYRRFSSKEDILYAALDFETGKMEAALAKRPVKGETAKTRVNRFFELLTQAMVTKPKLAQAMLRVVASGVPELAEKVAGYHARMTGLVLDAYHGEHIATDDPENPPTERALDIAFMLQQVWFASLVGWASGSNTPAQVVGHVGSAVDLILADED
jgi:AcrR family transcriptional regulator